MKTKLAWPLAAACLVGALSAISVSNSHAQTSVFEDFTTKSFDDTVQTTASWNTSLGRLELNSFTPSKLGGLSYPGLATGIAVLGNHVLTTMSLGSFAVANIADPTAPFSEAIVSTGAVPVDVTVSGNRAYVSAGSLGLQIYDVGNPAAPTLLGTFATVGTARSAYAAGSLVYVVSGSSLEVLDTRVPSSPVRIGLYASVGMLQKVWVRGRYAYLASGVAGLEVLDVSNPTVPTQVGVYDTPGYAYDVRVDSRFAYVADATTGLLVIDVRQPSTLALVGSYNSPGQARGLDVDGTKVYLADATGGLAVVDVSVPSAPALLFQIPTVDSAFSVEVAGSHAYVADGLGGLGVYEVHQPTTPVPVTSRTFTGFMYQSDVADGIAYVSRGSVGLEILDAVGLGLPILGTFVSVGSVGSVTVVGNTAFLASGDAGLEVVDVADPALPVLLGSYDPVGWVAAVQVQGNFAFLAAPSNMFVVDVSNPVAPVLAGSYTSTGIGVNYDIQVAGDRAYVSNSAQGLIVLDITDPWVPAWITTVDLSGGITSQRAEIRGSYAYVPHSNVGVKVIDLQTMVSVAIMPGFFDGIAVKGDELFAVERTAGLQVFDISDPTAPTLTSRSYALSAQGRDVQVWDGRAYICQGATFEVVDVAQRRLDSARNVGVSTFQGISTGNILRARLSVVENGVVNWELTADNGTNWQSLSPTNSWVGVAVPGNSLGWRATLDLQPFGDPSVDQLQIDVLGAAAQIEAIGDVGNDQGRQVRLEWSRSGHDFVGDSMQITQYAVYRKVEAGLAPAKADGFASERTASPAPSAQTHALAMAAAGWDFVALVPVRVQDRYSVVVPTMADSTIASGSHLSTFVVSALTATPGVFFDSPADSGYSVDNLAPSVPLGIVAAYQVNGVSLDWADNTESDLQFYRVYRGVTPGFVPDATNLLHESAVSAWTDPTVNPWGYVYKISAVDFSGNESSVSLTQTATDAPAAGQVRFALRAAVPNPFNPATTLRYSLDQPGPVRMTIYNAAGRAVRTLVDATQSAGEHRVEWTGKDQSGRSVASGVYYYELRSNGRVERRRMVLVK